MSVKIIEIVKESVNYLNQFLEKKIPIDQGVNSPLFGESSVLDSMSLVTLIVDLEERLEKTFNQSFILASDKAMSQKRSPFLTLGTLSHYIETLLLEEKMPHKTLTLITGTRKGIGKYLVEYYTNLGHDVIGCSRNDSELNLPNYKHVIADVSNEKEVLELFKWIRKEYGYLNHLINNAGIASMNHTIITPMGTVQNILNTNVIGTFLFCREAAKLMLKRKQGRIVNFTTVATPLKLEGEAMYAASKAAVLSLTEVLARELADYGITVNSIGPTPIETDLIRSVPAEKMQRLIARQAIKRMGNFEDISNVIDFYIDKKSSFVTGQNIYLGGI